MRLPCKVFPRQEPHPAFPNAPEFWAPVLNVRLSYRNSRLTKTIECWIDSGADFCIFHSDLCFPLGIRHLEDGVRGDLHGVITGPQIPIYFHKLTVMIYNESFETMAGFSHGLSVTGVLGLRGFFENFVVKIDASTSPPYFEIEKIHRI